MSYDKAWPELKELIDGLRKNAIKDAKEDDERDDLYSYNYSTGKEGGCRNVLGLIEHLEWKYNL